MGYKTIDGETGQVGPELAEWMKYNFLSGCTDISNKSHSVLCKCKRDNRLCLYEAEYPCVITFTKSIIEPRYPSVRMKIKSKNIEIPILCKEDFENEDADFSDKIKPKTLVQNIYPLKKRMKRTFGDGKDIEKQVSLIMDVINKKSIKEYDGKKRYMGLY